MRHGQMQRPRRLLLSREEKKKPTGGSPPKKPKQYNSLKLALSSKLTTALVTQHHMFKINAEAVFNSVYNKAIAEGQQEN